MFWWLALPERVSLGRQQGTGWRMKGELREVLEGFVEMWITALERKKSAKAGIPHCGNATGPSLALLHPGHKEGISSFIYSISCHVDPKMASIPTPKLPCPPLWLAIPILSLKKQTLNGRIVFSLLLFSLRWGGVESLRLVTWELAKKSPQSVDLCFCLRVVSVGVGTEANWKGARTAWWKNRDKC